jgi:hypothetical protein
VIVKANQESEAGTVPSERLLTEMGTFNEELVNAGMMLAGEGLHPTARSVRVSLSGDKPAVLKGPFLPIESQIAGFWLWQVKSFDEAIEWAKRIPTPEGEPAEFEIRPVFEADDFGPSFTPELREQEARLRARSEARSADVK